MSDVLVRPHLGFDEGWETISFETFIEGWLRSSGVRSGDGFSAPPFWMFRLDQRLPQSFVAKFGRDRWFPAPFETTEQAYVAACESIGRQVAEAEPWMVNLTDYIRHVSASKRPDVVPAKTLRRLRNKRTWILAAAAEAGRTTSVPHAGWTDLLAHVNYTRSRYERCYVEQAGLDYPGLSLAFSTIEQPDEIARYSAPDLSGATVLCDVSIVDLAGADLRQCDLSEARGLTSSNTAGAWFDDHTKFPLGFDPHEHSMIMGCPVGEPVEPLDLPVNVHVPDPQGQRSDL